MEFTNDVNIINNRKKEIDLLLTNIKDNLDKLKDKNDEEKQEFILHKINEFIMMNDLQGACIPISIINSILFNKLFKKELIIKYGEITIKTEKYHDIIGFHCWNEMDNKVTDISISNNLAIQNLPYKVLGKEFISNKCLNNVEINYVENDFNFILENYLNGYNQELDDYNDAIHKTLDLLNSIDKNDKDKEIYKVNLINLICEFINNNFIKGK